MYTRAILVFALLLSAPTVSLAQDNAPDVSIAIYERGFSVIEERRRHSFAAGKGIVAIDDLPNGFRPETAVFDFADSNGVVLKGQRYLPPTPSLLTAFVGKMVHIIRVDPSNGSEVVKSAKLLRAVPSPMVEIDGRVELSIPGRIALPNMPDDALLKPTMVLDVEAVKAGTYPYRFAYLTEGPGWSADYALQLDETERWATLQGRATLRNPSGRTYRAASVRLISGNVNRVSARQAPQRMLRKGMAMMAAESMPVADQPTAVSELQVYSLPGRLDLVATAQEKAILFKTVRVAVEKTYHLESSANAHVRGHHGNTQRQNPAVRLSFPNDRANGLGIPLPHGVARLYGGGLFLGEDNLRHTPKGQKVSLRVGRAVDVTTRRKRTDHRTQGLPKGTAEAAYEIVLANAKPHPVTVEVIERLAGEWRILSESAAHVKLDDRRAMWRVKVPAEGEAKLEYRARVKFR